MKKWQNLAAPDDPDSYYDVDGVWPTDRGTYETADFLTGDTDTLTGVTDIVYAWRELTSAASSTNPSYIVDSAKIYQHAGAGTYNDRTGAVTFAFIPRFHFAQFGSVTIGALGSNQGTGLGAATIAATSPTSNFAALAGAPEAQTVVVQSNVVLLFNTSNARDGWSASDVGDYTNWTTNEATSGRIYTPAGRIYAAVAFGDAVYVFKFASIHRMTYVGGQVKWLTEKAYNGIGCANSNRACAGATGILFSGYSQSDTGSPTVPYYWYDGVSPPVLTNPLVDINATGPIIYHPLKNIFSVWKSDGSAVYYYNPENNMWGRNTAPFGSGISAIPFEGSVLAGSGSSVTTTGVRKSAADTVITYGLTSPSNVGSGYLETMKMGRPDRKTNFNRATPILRRKVDAGADAATVTLTLFRERSDTTAQTTRTGITKSSARERYDLLGGTHCDNYGRVKYSFTDLDIEIDDLAVTTADGGED